MGVYFLVAKAKDHIGATFIIIKVCKVGVGAGHFGEANKMVIRLAMYSPDKTR